MTSAFTRGRSGAGVLVPFGDVTEAVRQLLALAEDPERARAMGRAGHRLAQRQYDWDVVAPTFLAALEDAAARRSHV